MTWVSSLNPIDGAMMPRWFPLGANSGGRKEVKCMSWRDCEQWSTWQKNKYNLPHLQWRQSFGHILDFSISKGRRSLTRLMPLSGVAVHLRKVAWLWPYLFVTAVKQSENNILLIWFTSFLVTNAPSLHSLSSSLDHCYSLSLSLSLTLAIAVIKLFRR